MELQLICDEYLCGLCYQDTLFEKVPEVKTKGPENMVSVSKNIKSPVILVVEKPHLNYWVFPSLEDALEWAKEFAQDLEWHTQAVYTAKGISIIRGSVAQ